MLVVSNILITNYISKFIYSNAITKVIFLRNKILGKNKRIKYIILTILLYKKKYIVHKIINDFALNIF